VLLALGVNHGGVVLPVFHVYAAYCFSLVIGPNKGISSDSSSSSSYKSAISFICICLSLCGLFRFNTNSLSESALVTRAKKSWLSLQATRNHKKLRNMETKKQLTSSPQPHTLHIHIAYWGIFLIF
jgi:hypothetical protein